MSKRIFLSGCLMVIALVTLGANNSCQAPMDATGTYSGTWLVNVVEGESIVDTIECGTVRMTLTQDVTLDPPKNLKVTGTIFIDDYACLEEAGWPAGLIPKAKEVAVTGTMSAKDGKITLSSGGLGTGTGVIFIITGYGESEDSSDTGIPLMTKYSGNWGLAVSVVFIGTAEIGGTFEVERVEETS